MRTSLRWLNDYLDRPIDAEEAERCFTDLGFPIDAREAVTTSAGGRDQWLEVEVTSNRPDLLSHLGQAREIAAATGRSVKAPSPEPPERSVGGEPIDRITSVVVEESARSLCPLYTARLIRGVKVGPSPAWLVDRLEAAGLRSVSNVVDVTNFVLLEMGQPLHAFDLARLEGRRVVVRRAVEGESFVAIDASTHKLRSDMLVIADAVRPQAIAGLMGGSTSEVGPGTTDLLLESAVFDPLNVRRTSRSLKLSSDSSYRFERGVDIEGVDRASRRAAALIVELAGGRIAPGRIAVGPARGQTRRVSMRTARCRAILGIDDLPTDRMIELLGRLGLAPGLERSADGVESIVCTAPTHRPDLEREIDLIEEVARLHGLAAVPMRERIRIEARGVQRAVVARRVLGQTLQALGFCEAVNFSFVSESHGGPFVPEGRAGVVIRDDRRRGEPMLRPSILPSLLACRKHNQDRGNLDVRLYETAATWHEQPDRPGQPIETRRLGLLMDVSEPGGAGLRDLRGAVEALLSAMQPGGTLTLRPMEGGAVSSPSFLRAAGAVGLEGRAIGVIGLAEPALLSLFDLQSPVALAELELDPLLAEPEGRRTPRRLPRFPGTWRDLSVIVDEPVRWSEIESAVLRVQPALLESVEFLTVYRGKPIPSGRKSVSLRMVFRDETATLRHEQVEPQVAAVVAGLRSAVGAELRG